MWKPRSHMLRSPFDLRAHDLNRARRGGYGRAIAKSGRGRAPRERAGGSYIFGGGRFGAAPARARTYTTIRICIPARMYIAVAPGPPELPGGNPRSHNERPRLDVGVRDLKRSRRRWARMAGAKSALAGALPETRTFHFRAPGAKWAEITIPRVAQTRKWSKSTKNNNPSRCANSEMIKITKK